MKVIGLSVSWCLGRVRPNQSACSSLNTGTGLKGTVQRKPSTGQKWFQSIGVPLKISAGLFLYVLFFFMF
jgi:hypothetical protein